MQVEQTTLENVIDIIENEGYPNVKLFLQYFGKDFSILNFLGDHTAEEAKQAVLKRAAAYPNGADFKIVLSQSKTANSSSVLVFFFSTKNTNQNTPTHQPQPQAQYVGLGSVDNVGLGAVELERKKRDADIEALKGEFALLLEKNSLKDQRNKFKEEKREFENQQRFALAKKFGEGLGAVAIQYAQNHPVLSGLLGQLGTTQPTGLGAATEEEESYDPKESLFEDLQDGSITIQDIQEVLNNLQNQNQNVNSEQEEEETNED
ncbi:hypothetical protein V9L05_08650 [Bernardetia sp. Wsw4-3y2]|uniref:hypothetical protein n=1 Tax=Bernardetia sp. Wsw4-3y2 TaxID=3127471 RepID=UPI0030CA632B